MRSNAWRRPPRRQSVYDMAYIQCMYSKGNAIPEVVAPGPRPPLPPPSRAPRRHRARRRAAAPGGAAAPRRPLPAALPPTHRGAPHVPAKSSHTTLAHWVARVTV